MNKFKKLGFIHTNGGLHINNISSKRYSPRIIKEAERTLNWQPLGTALSVAWCWQLLLSWPI